jgi:hypothetical protein
MIAIINDYDIATTMTNNNAMTMTLDASSTTMACRFEQWVYNRWKTNF